MGLQILHLLPYWLDSPWASAPCAPPARNTLLHKLPRATINGVKCMIFGTEVTGVLFLRLGWRSLLHWNAHPRSFSKSHTFRNKQSASVSEELLISQLNPCVSSERPVTQRKIRGQRCEESDFSLDVGHSSAVGNGSLGKFRASFATHRLSFPRKNRHSESTCYLKASAGTLERPTYELRINADLGHQG